MSLAQVKEQSQGLLFSEPSIAETGVWCQLSEGIDPENWAYFCRYLGRMSPKEFKRAQKRVFGNPDSVMSRLKRLFWFEQGEYEGVELVSFGYSGVRKQCQM
jgi:hypothetical protein